MTGAGKIAIIGGGIAGVTTAIALEQKGFSCVVYEAAAELKEIGAGLGLAANAMMAFERLGIAAKIIAAGRILPVFSILDEKGKRITYTDSFKNSRRFQADNFTFHRGKLHQVLLSQVRNTPVFTQKKCISIREIGEHITLQFADGTEADADYLVVADGIHSAIRQQLLPQSKPRYAGYTCWRAVVDNSQLKIDQNTETWGSKGRFGFIPLANNELCWFACINSSHAGNEEYKHYTLAMLQDNFKDYHADVINTLKATKPENLIWNDIFDLEPVSQYAFGRIVLIGDAAHATTPNLGQGACQAVEDAVVLADEMSTSGSIEAAFRNFEQRRLKRTHAVVKHSRRLGRIAQMSNPLLVKVRNAVARLMPARMNGRFVEFFLDVDFNK